MNLKLDRDIILVLLSLVVQVPLAILLGHFFDERVFMATGYLVSSGLNPYAPFNFAGVFPSYVISGVIPQIGYPPPYPLILGLLYKVSYAVTQNIFVYNFATKIPVIIGDITLAFLVRHILRDMQVNKKKVQLAFVFILFNPFILLSTVAWGEFDVLIAALCLASLFVVTKGKVALSALLMGIAVALKPIALPLAPVPFLFATPAIDKKARVLYAAVFAVSLLGLYFGPFVLTGWQVPLGADQWNAQVQKAGGMTLFSLEQFFTSQGILPASFSLLGYLWIPALLAAYYLVYRFRPSNLADLVKMAAAVMLVFFLSRSWVSEPNVNLLVPLMLLLATLGFLKFRYFHLTWMIPLAFMFPNDAFSQLFFIVAPSTTQMLVQFNAQYGEARLTAMLLIIVVWIIFASSILRKIFQKKLPPTQRR